MDTSNIIAIALGGTGFIISIIGLVVAPLLNLKSKRLEKRLEFRFKLFEKILELWELANKNNSIDETSKPLFLEINKLIQLYGYNKEIQLFRNVIEIYNNYEQKDRQKLILEFNKFFENSFNTYRKEIVLEKLDQ